MRRFTTTVRLASVISLLLTCGVGLLTRAQTSTQASPKLTVANKIDEYGQIGGCDQSARLDNFAISLQEDPNMTGYVVIYGPEGENWGRGKRQFAVINDYLVNSRGLAGERIRFMYGGRNDDLTEPKIQLWLAPQEAEPPAPQRYETNIRTFTGKFIEYQAWDIRSVEYADEGTGPAVIGVALPSFADVLSQQKETAAYVVAYNGPEAVPGAWRRVAEHDVAELRELGVEPDRLRVIYGGRNKTTKVQLWVLPKTAPPPVVDAGSEGLPDKAVQMSTFSDYDLSSEENQQSAFKDLVEVLSLNHKLRAFIVVRLESPSANENESSEVAGSNEKQLEAPPVSTEVAEESVSDELENRPVDFPRLIQKWTSEIVKHKIQSDRFIVLFVAAREQWGASMETWIVPAGVPLPDPFAEDEPPEDSNDPLPNFGELQPPSKPAK